MSSSKLTPKKLAAFLKQLCDTGNVAASAKTAGINKQTCYDERKRNSDFAKAWDEALDISVDLLISEARRRAFEGVEEPVFYQGSECGQVRRYSDVLLMFLIKGIRKEYATERKELTGSDGAPLRLEVVTGVDRAPNESMKQIEDRSQCVLTQDTNQDITSQRSTET